MRATCRLKDCAIAALDSTWGCVLERVEFRHSPHRFGIIAIDKLISQLDPCFGTELFFHSHHSDLVVDELVANGTKVEFESADAHRKLVVFDVTKPCCANAGKGTETEVTETEIRANTFENIGIPTCRDA